MINLAAFYKISYGLYIVSSGDKDKGNGFISNTVFQVTSEPPQLAACCNKNNYTAELIARKAAFSVSVLSIDTPPAMIGLFGFRSGRDTGKMAGVSLSYGMTGVPKVLTSSLAVFECRVTNTIDAGTHFIFIGEIVDSEMIDEKSEPLSYDWYRKVRKGIAPKNAPTYIDPDKLKNSIRPAEYRKYKCMACGYIYDEEKEGAKFSELPDDWKCPVCGSEKSDFIEV